MSEAGRATGAGLVMSAGIANAAVGGALASGEATGLIMAATRRAVQAGQQGWDVDGNFVSSKFVFNFQTMELFDGSETHPISAVTGATFEDNIVKLYLKNRIQPNTIAVGNPQRGETICRVIGDMLDGETYVADGHHRLGTVISRSRIPGFGTLIRYGIRSILLAIPLTFFFKASIDNYGSMAWYEYKTAIAIIFLLSMAWRLLRPVRAPQWRSI